MLIDKVTSVENALDRLVRAGDHLHLAYSQARPNAAVLALVRQFAGTGARFTISTGGLVSSQAALVSEGLVGKVIASFIGDNYPNAAPNAVFQRAIDAKAVEVDETSLWTVFARLVAGALGVGYLPVRSLVGSDLADQSWVGTVVDPFTGEATTVVEALVPDITIVHAVAADPDGNAILSPPYGETAWGSLAARRGVIIGAERIVDRATIRKYQSLVGIPSHQVQAVCHVPFGAHPYGLYSPIVEIASYVEDEAFIHEQRRACAEESTQRSWVAEWIEGTSDHAGYLAKVGQERLQHLVDRAAEARSAIGVDVSPAERTTCSLAPPLAEERMVLEAARLIVDRVSSGGSNLIMTGIGYAHLAAWVAHRQLDRSRLAAPLMAEIGAYGYTPAPGDPFIFSQRNLPTCTWMTDVPAILGSALHAGTSRAVAALGAGSIDAAGNTNSSRSPSGGYLVGSGGANDIATSAADVVVVVKHSRSRLVADVEFVTCPGARVSAIVTTKGLLERDPQTREFVLTAVPPGPEPIQVRVRDAVDSCGWPLRVADDVASFAPVDPSTLQLLRSFDPRHAFLSDPTPAR